MTCGGSGLIRTDCGQGRHHLDEDCPGCEACQPAPCGTCGGEGQIMVLDYVEHLPNISGEPCPACNGSGKEGR